MVEKGIRGEICHGIHRPLKTNNKYMKDCDDNNKESSYIKYGDVYIYTDGHCHKGCLQMVLSKLEKHFFRILQWRYG